MRKLNLKSITLVALLSTLFYSSTAYANNCAASQPFFEKVDHIGAVGAQDWTTGWTNYNPVVANYPRPMVTIDKPILKDFTMEEGKCYLLKGMVYVMPGVTLHIEKGVTVRGDKRTNAALVVTKGAQIRAMGTREKPIVFTSSMPIGRRRSGDWGGIILLGQAKINSKSGSALMEGGLDPRVGRYGGQIDDDNSGVIQYVRIEFGGRKLNQQNELNGLTIAGIGSRTKLSHIQVSFTSDDSFEFYGGRANADHLISYKCMDDDFDMSYGFHGNLQYGIALRHPRIKDFSGSKGVEVDSYSSDDNIANINTKLLTRGTISNFTIVSPMSKVQGVAQLKQGIYIGNDAYLNVYNSVVLGFNFGIFVKTDKSQQGIISGLSNFENNVFVGSKFPIANKSGANSDLNNYFSNPRLSNFHYVKDDLPLLEDPHNLRYPRFSPAKDSKISRGASFKKMNYDKKLFAKDIKYAGAFKSDNWFLGWTNFNPLNKTYPDASTPVSGTLNSKTVWTSAKTYLIKGLVYVNDELVIREGTIIKGDKASRGTLVIGPKGKLIVEGTKTNPVVFTSNEEEGNRSAGDWGGIVILNTSKVNSKAGNSFYKSQLISIPGAKVFGGTNESYSSGSIKYARIEFAGAKLTAHTNSALTLAGVSCMDVDNLQISYSGGNGLSWIGGKSNAKHIVSFASAGDDFVANLGYSGTVRYGVVIRDPLIATKGSNAIESKSSPDGKLNLIRTNPKFKNFTVIGPLKSSATQFNNNYSAAVFIHSNSSLSLENSIISGYPIGFVLASPKTDFYANAEELQLKNNVFAGMLKSTYVKNPTSRLNYDKWLSDNGNTIATASTAIKLKSAYDRRNPDLTPSAGSPALEIK
ncbi:MAG: hypothetical protein AB8B61_03500 [Cyclobacteriaceae bacterium]